VKEAKELKYSVIKPAVCLCLCAIRIEEKANIKPTVFPVREYNEIIPMANNANKNFPLSLIKI
jgi:hypothetical protein